MWKTYSSLVLLVLVAYSSFSQIVRQDVLVVGMMDDPDGLDPAHETSYAGIQINSVTFDTLVEYHPETGDIQPSLAQEWKISSDGYIYTFTLAGGVRFHNGIEFTADDVVFSLTRQWDSNNPYYQYGPWSPWNRMGLDELIVSVTAVDRHTVRIELARPHVSFLEMLSMNFASIVSLAAVQKYGADFSRHPVGTGPFRFVSWKKDSELVLIRNRNYWRDPPRLNRLVFKFFRSNEDRVEALEKGTVDVIEFPSTNDIVRLRLADTVTLVQQIASGISYLTVNTQKEALQRPGVRKGLAHALDREKILLSAGKEEGVLAESMLPSLSERFPEAHFNTAYDPVIAQALLSSEGYGQEKQQLSLSLYIPSGPLVGISSPMDIAEEIQGEFSEVGVKIKIVRVPVDSYAATLEKGEHDLALYSWIPASLDPYALFISLFSPDQRLARSFSFWNHAEFLQKMESASSSDEKETSWTHYSLIQSLLYEEAILIPLFHPVITIAARKEVKGITLSREGRQLFQYIWIE